MVPVPEYTYDYWSRGPQDLPPTTLTCFMPNGVVIPLEANRNATLSEIKEDLWEEASKYPLHGTLHDMSVYVFACINSMAETEELLDENRRLCDVRPFCAILRVTECKGDKADKTLNTQISHLIGKGLHEFDSLNNAEVNDFRWQMRRLVDEIAHERQNKSWMERLCYQFPPRLSFDATPPATKAIVLLIKFESTETAFTFHEFLRIFPAELLRTILNKKATKLNTRGERPDDFVLKVCGQEEYIVGDYPLYRFLYIQECLAREVTPTLVTVSVNSIPVMTDNEYENVDSLDMKRPRQSSSTLTLRKKGKHVISWDIEENFMCTISAIAGLNCDMNRPVEIGIQAGLFHGGKSLCEPQKTTERQVSKKSECEYNEQLVFDIKVANIPRMARLCFVIYEVTKTARAGKLRRLKESSNKELFINPLAWVNTTVYDFKKQLKSGAMTLYLWTYAEDIQSDDGLHPLGTVVSNPNVDHAAVLTLTFDNYAKEQTVMYPSREKMINFAHKNNSLDLPLIPNAGYIEHLRLMAERDPLHEMHEQERKTIWAARHYCMTSLPELLPKLLYCVEWNDYKEVAEITTLLEGWPLMPPEKALELLDYAYADQAVRSYAVRCLSDISDDDILLYLLQLVQALKHESYLVCDLVEYLLKRALNNQKIGHYLFWHLRSEMHVACVSVRFGLILESYCRGSQEHIPLLIKQMECLEKLKASTDLVRQKRDKDKAKTALHEYFSEPSCVEIINNFISPLDPRYRCKSIKLEKCKVMDSKMRPLWIVFENFDVHGEDVYIIFKNGDDLRQDMLTLQMIRIMDRLWKKEGLDLRMNPYGCISTDHRVGMIEVVLNAETIANIQKEKGMFSATSAFRKGSLLAWLKDYNPTEVTLNKAIDEFTLSCAGYCVATYILGVADRHSDNIMVKKTGQLFHIDFGHILGHFKEKFGFKRERVPFVLTHDFVHVINRGKKEALEFKIFQKHCEQAFLILRRHGCLILSLCAMMISTGLPELSSEKDLNYLRDTLVLDLSEQEALNHFRSKFNEALCNSWKTSLNWASHNLAKNNKQ